MGFDQSEVEKLGEEKIDTGKKLIERLNLLTHIQGVGKVQKKISAEISTLKNAIISKRLKINHIACSNLVHFSYLVKVLEETNDVVGVDFPIKLRGSQKSTIRIDIVANNGKTWIKVIARNPKALNDIALGRSNYGAKSILDHASCYIEAAKDNLQCFQTPKVVFDFANPIDNELANSLEELHIDVRIDGTNKSSGEMNEPIGVNSKLNLDVTTMMAFVSALTCESCDWEFTQKILSEQAHRERSTSTKTFLDELFQGKELIACETAKDSFLSILNVVGGPNEKIRASKLLNSVTFLPDINEIEENSLWSGNVKLRLGKKIQHRTYKVFTFGMYHKAITVTANKGAAEAAKMGSAFRWLYMKQGP
ncbi:UPF0415 protein C7orf25 homolog isoform X2 [Sitodiplosis mosellana]|uniref:UPF0415 protein C7orf25 homolog isoform X2 n=1 Tax=Sitodiplosis mosellana TaxID=263140 RepID=UPI002444E6F0|nr:UPF0415 protein C7orf25 homolog isoform X2 [Sitodiplosis mosellana]